ncbi:membrane protein insertase YidC [Desulfothermus sp.]
MNENTRLMLALGLTILVLLVWNTLFPPPKQKTQYNSTKKVEKSQSSNQIKKESNTVSIPNQTNVNYSYSKGETITIETPYYIAKVNSQGGIFEQFELTRYKNSIKPDSKNVCLITKNIMGKGPLGILFNYNPTWKVAKWEYSGSSAKLSKNDSTTLTFKAQFEGTLISRKLTFYGNSYKIEEELVVYNTSNHPLAGILGVCIAAPSEPEHSSRFNKKQVVYYTKENKLEKESSEKKLGPGIEFKQPINWAGIEDNYFLLSIVPISANYTLKAKLEDETYRLAVESKLNLPPNKGTSFKNLYYIGPKKAKYLEKLPNHLSAAINYGWLDILAKPLVIALNFFYKYTHNYGIAIIILTIVIKILFWPLSHKSYKSMEQMKKIQPLMQQLKEKYKDDKQKLNEELMRLYKTYKINPAGGCIPMLLQIPVFIALYEALLGAIELRHSPFIYHLPFTNIIWLADLSAKDPLYITPILMGVTMFLQQKMTPSAGDPTQAKLMLLMPVFLTFLFLNFPSGLVIYFITNNVLSIIQQWWMLKKN